MRRTNTATTGEIQNPARLGQGLVKNRAKAGRPVGRRGPVLHADAVSQPSPLAAISRSDDHRLLTWLALGGFTVALGIAVLGLPTLDLHGPLHRLGIMDPFCGGTRAARYTMLGQFALAWTYNPLGIVAVGVALLATVRAVVGFVFHRWINLHVAITPRLRWLLVGILVVVLMTLEVRQQSIAPLLMQSTLGAP